MAEQAYAYVTLIPVAKGFQKQVAKQLDGVGGAGGKAGQVSGKNFSDGFSGQLKKLGLVAAGALATAGVGKFLGDSIKRASDLGESLNAVNVVFEESAAGIEKIGQSASKNLGLSQTEFNAAAVQFSSFAEKIAGDGGDVVGTIDELTTRGADFASVMNLEVSEALQVFQSGLAGETEPLKKFGIDLSQASIEAFALESGIVAAGESMTENQKVQARYGALLEQTAKTSGDFANTSDSLANQQRILGAEFKGFQATVGSALVPTLERLLGVVSENLLPVFEDFGNWLESPEGTAAVQTLSDVVVGLAEFLINVTTAVVDQLPVLTALGAAYLLTTGRLTAQTIATGAATIAQLALNAAMAANPIGLLLTGLALAVVGVTAFMNANKDATPSQEELSQKLDDTNEKLDNLKTALDEGTISQREYEIASSQLKDEQRNLRGALQDSYNWTEEQKDASFRARDAALAQRFATDDLTEATEAAEAINTGYVDSLDAYQAKSALYRGTSDNIAEGLGNVSQQAALASLGISQLSLSEQARAIVADDLARQQLFGGGEAKNAITFTEALKGLMAEAEYGLDLFAISQEEVDEYAKSLGYSVEESDNATGSVTNYNSELDNSIGTTHNATDAVNGLAGAYGNLSNAIAGATPGDPGPGGMFEVEGPGGSYLASLDDSVRGQLRGIEANIAKEFGTQAVDRIVSSALGGTLDEVNNTLRRGTEFVNEETGRVVVGNIQGRRAEELIAEGFQEVGKVSASNEDLTKAIKQLSDDITSGNIENYTPFARGGLVTGPTRALIGEAGPEVVIPLNRFENMMDTGDGKTLVYNAAPNQTLDSDQALFQAMRRAKVVAGW